MPTGYSSQPKADLQHRLVLESSRLKAAAKELPRGAAREALIRRARQMETAAHLNEWLSSPGLQPPK
jgi:hypothetical protein